jgi:glycosyltransferase involved in cell wall biosynthesis
LTAAGGPKPRVLLACEWFVKYTAGLTRGLADRGCEVAMLTRDHDLEFGGQPGEMRSFVREALGESPVHLELGGRVRSPSALAEVARMRRWRNRWAPDVVHIQDSLANDLRLAFVGGLRGGRYALTVHDPVPHPGDAAPARWVPALRRLLRRRAGLVFVHSEALAEELRATGEVSAPVEVVPHGAEEGSMEPIRLPDSLLFFGRMSYYKGLDVLLEAMPRVWEARPDVGLTVAGEGHIPEHPVLADARVTLRAEHVPESEVPALMAGSSCLVLPYRQASQSGVGSLARQYGRAVVATRVGGLPELVSPDWGRLVPSEDPAALAAAILEIVDTPGLAERMGRNAVASLGEASWSRVAELTLEAYRRYLL